MNLRDLRYIVSVAATGSFSKAAENCHVSQPALSTQIRKMEDYLGAKIFERTSRRIIPTEAGDLVIKHARKILREADSLQESVRISCQNIRQNISIGCFPTLAPYLFPMTIPKLSEKESIFKLTLIEEKTYKLLEMLNKGELDIAILALPVPVDGMCVHTIFSEEFYLCVPKEHNLASLSRIHYEDLINEELLLLKEGHCLRDQALAICSMQGLSYRRDYEATSLETLRQMVVSRGGITLIPNIAIKKENSSDLVYLNIEPTPPSRTIVMLWKEESIYNDLYTNEILPEFMITNTTSGTNNVKNGHSKILLKPVPLDKIQQ